MTFEEYKKREEKKIETAKKFMEAGVEFEDIKTERQYHYRSGLYR